MGGITGYIAALSMSNAQQNVQRSASVSMLKNTMDSAEMNASKLVESLNEIPAPTSGAGSLLDVRA